MTNRTEYAHRDSLGSLDVVTDASRNVLTRTTFDPFGGRRESNWAGLDRSNHCCKKIDAQYPLQTNRRTAWTLTPWINRLNQRFQIGPRKYPIQRRQERFPFI